MEINPTDVQTKVQIIRRYAQQTSKIVKKNYKLNYNLKIGEGIWDSGLDKSGMPHGRIDVSGFETQLCSKIQFLANMNPERQ